MCVLHFSVIGWIFPLAPVGKWDVGKVWIGQLSEIGVVWGRLLSEPVTLL